MDEIKNKIIENLREVYDPEISINIYDLGLIYDIDLSTFPKVKITHTLTSAFCPSADEIIWGIRQASMIEGVEECEIITTFDPPFSFNMISDEVKLEIGML
jgi:metal-sulfur cluster biosynthetic enzyme